MPLDVGRLVTFNLSLSVTTREPNTEFIFTAERYEGHPTAVSLIIACSEGITEHRQLDNLGSCCEFYDGRYRCRWAGDNYDNGHLKEVTIELTRIK